MTLPIQVSGKYGDAIVVIGGTDPADFQNNVLSILGPDSLELVGKLFELALIQGAENTAMRKAQDNVIAAGMAQPGYVPTTSNIDAARGGHVVYDTQASVTQPQVPSTPVDQNSVHEETDRWGNTWTYNVPAAPSCPHGVRVQKKGRSQAGKNYTGWSCPTQSPFAYRNKVAKADCAMEWPAR